MKKKDEQILIDFYNNACDEDARFSTKSHKLEFLTTWKYIEKYLKKKSRILEVGAGTGNYSIPLAKLGHVVSAVELVEHNLEILKTKSDGLKNLESRQGNALDLSYYGDNLFDMVLVLGPMYHMYNQHDKKKVINEAIRVCKRGGVIMFAYITHGHVVAQWGVKKGHLKECKKMLLPNSALKSVPSEIFSTEYPSEFKKLFFLSGTRFEHNVATDGISEILQEYVDNLSDEEFEIWKNYHFSICEREEMQGYSAHMLYICKKI